MPAHDTSSKSDTYANQLSSTYLKGFKSYPVLSAQAFPSKVCSMEITQNGSYEEQPFLHTTHPLTLINMYAKYHQNISKDIRVIQRKIFPL